MGRIFCRSKSRLADYRSGYASIAALALAACTTFQYAGTNSTDQPLSYVAKVDGEKVASAPVTKQNPLATTTVGKFRWGRKIEVDVELPEGGRVSQQFQQLLDKPDPTLISVTTNAIQGTIVDLGKGADIEKTISDVSYLAPAPHLSRA